ncbi:hypothetical protein [Segatella copri]|uniref:Uncharacterized protein n=1 Tax=Segatella copri TaxID=165179 RepID=A0AAW5TXY5_9BACT|nr:hypothetical protein [Segatella copri]MCW4094570.1 hypothetical protein [Segatella copri]
MMARFPSRINKAKNIRTLMLRVPGEGRYEAISATDSKGRQTGWKKEPS